MQGIDEAVLQHIAAFLSPTNLRAVLPVSPFWYTTLTSPRLWKQLLYPQPQPTLGLYVVGRGTQHILPESIEPHYPICKSLKVLSLHSVLRFFLGQDAFLLANECFDVNSHAEEIRILPMTIKDVSSEDHMSQSASSTLDLVRRNFWSSTGSDTTDSEEFIVYELHQVSVIWAIQWIIYKATFQLGEPIYGPQRLQITTYLNIDDEKSIMFDSPEIDVVNLDVAQRWDIGSTWLVIGKYIRVRFIGKRQTQNVDNLYYTCIQALTIEGSSLRYRVTPLLFSFLADSDHLQNDGALENLSRNMKILIQQNRIQELVDVVMQNISQYPLDMQKFREQILETFLKENSDENLKIYLQSIYDSFDRLTIEESIAFVSLYMQNSEIGNLDLSCLSPSERLGDIFLETGRYRYALNMFHCCNAKGRMIDALIYLASNLEMAVYLLNIMSQLSTTRKSDYVNILQRITEIHNIEVILTFSLLLIETSLLPYPEVIDALMIISVVTKNDKCEIVIENLRKALQGRVE